MYVAEIYLPHPLTFDLQLVAFSKSRLHAVHYIHFFYKFSESFDVAFFRNMSSWLFLYYWRNLSLLSRSSTWRLEFRLCHLMSQGTINRTTFKNSVSNQSKITFLQKKQRKNHSQCRFQSNFVKNISQFKLDNT